MFVGDEVGNLMEKNTEELFGEARHTRSTSLGSIKIDTIQDGIECMVNMETLLASGGREVVVRKILGRETGAFVGTPKM